MKIIFILAFISSVLASDHCGKPCGGIRLTAGALKRFQVTTKDNIVEKNNLDGLSRKLNGLEGFTQVAPIIGKRLRFSATKQRTTNGMDFLDVRHLIDLMVEMHRGFLIIVRSGGDADGFWVKRHFSLKEKDDSDSDKTLRQSSSGFSSEEGWD